MATLILQLLQPVEFDTTKNQSITFQAFTRMRRYDL